MHAISLFFSDIPGLLQAIGYVGFGLFIFAESGLLIGFVLPGDTLLFPAGLLAATGYFSLPLLLLIGIVAAIVGDSVGYATGKALGPTLFNKENSFIFSKKNLEKSVRFYERHGAKTILLARFIPIVRTFAPVLAGASHMRYRTFLIYNIAGGIFWNTILLMAGFFLGKNVPNIDRYILPIVAGILIVSFIPIIWRILFDRYNKKG